MSVHELSDPVGDAGGRVVMVHVHGAGTADVGVRYYSGPVAPPALTGHIDIRAITGVTDEVASVAPTGGLATYQPIVITLARFLVQGPYDPGKIFRRVNPAAWPHVRVTSTIPSAFPGSGDILVDRDPAVLGGQQTLHVGRECFTASGTDGDGTDGDPWRLTGVTRGQRGTPILQHFVGGREPVYPYITREAMTWDGRQVTLYVARLRLDGTVGDWAVFWHGHLSGEPKPARDAVKLTVIPSVSRLDTMLSGAVLATTLHPTRKILIEEACTLEIEQAWDEGAAFDVQTDVATGAGASPIKGPTQPHKDVFDITLGAGHPRAGLVRVTGATRGEFRPTAYTVGPEGYTTALAGAPGALATDHLRNAACAERVAISLITELGAGLQVVSWPRILFDTINDAAGWAPGTRDGLGGMWADVRLVRDGDAGPRLLITYNPNDGGDPLRRSGPLRVRFSAGGRPAAWGPPSLCWRSGEGVPAVPLSQFLWYPLDLAEPGDDRHVQAATSARLVRGAVQVSGPARGGWTREILVNRNGDADGLEAQIRGLCTAGWHQELEEWITTVNGYTVPSLGSMAVRVEYDDRAAGGARTSRVVRIIEVQEVEDGVWGLKLGTLDRYLLPSCGDWPGYEPVKISPTIAFEPSWPKVVMLRVMHSIAGGAVTDPTFDAEPFGLELDAAHVNRASILAAVPPVALDRWAPVVPAKGIKAKDLIQPMLRLMGCAMVQRRDAQGRSEVAVVSTGVPTSTEVVLDLTDAIMAIDPPPDEDIDSKVVNVRAWSSDYDAKGEATLTQTFHDGGSISAYGSKPAEEIALRGIDLRGDSPLDGVIALQSADARLAVIDGYSRLVWRVKVPTAHGYLLYPGACVRVTSEYLNGFSDADGVTQALARVISMRLRIWGDGCDLALAHFGVKASGWNACLQVTSRPSSTEVVVAANAYTDSEDPITGAAATDLDSFAVGDPVVVRPFGDDDSGVETTIVAIDTATRTVEFADAHGLTSPLFGRVVPRSYDAAAAVHQAYGFMADVGGTLGAGNVPGFVLV